MWFVIAKNRIIASGAQLLSHQLKEAHRYIGKNNSRKCSINLSLCRQRNIHVLIKFGQYVKDTEYVEDKILKYVQWIRGLHTSSRQQVSPALWLLVKPVAKVSSAIAGRTFRKFWQTLSPEQKAAFKEKYKLWFAKGFTAFCFIIVANYIYHTEDVPETNRKRYMAFTHQQLLQLIALEREMLLQTFNSVIVDPTIPLYKKVSNVAERIIKSNSDIPFFSETNWKIHLIKSEEFNAFVLPTGDIFVCLGIFNVITNEDQLAVILGHEMAHAYLGHAAEKLSFVQFIDVLVIFGLGALWAVIPADGIALVSNWFMHKVVNFMFLLPYSRRLESEADRVGLKLIAKACFDVRESSNLWVLLKVQNKLAQENEELEWLSTHPSNDNRIRMLNNSIPQVEGIRSCQQCPRLSSKDPREDGFTLLKSYFTKDVWGELDYRPHRTTTSPTLPVMSPVLSLTGPALPVTSPTLSLASPTLPVTSPALPVS